MRILTPKQCVHDAKTNNHTLASIILFICTYHSTIPAKGSPITIENKTVETTETVNFEGIPNSDSDPITLDNSGTINFFDISDTSPLSLLNLTITNSNLIQSTSASFSENPVPELASVLPIGGEGSFSYTHSDTPASLTINTYSFTGTLSITNNTCASAVHVTAATESPSLDALPTITLAGEGPISFTPSSTYTPDSFKYLSFSGTGEKTINLSNIAATTSASTSIPVLITGNSCSASSSDGPTICTSVTPGAIALRSDNDANIHLRLDSATNIGTIRADSQSAASLIHVSSSTSSGSPPPTTTFVNEANSNIRFSGTNDFTLRQRNGTWKHYLLLGTDSQLSGITKATYQIEITAPTVSIDIMGADTPRDTCESPDAPTPSNTQIINSTQLSSDITISSYVSMDSAPISIKSTYGNPSDDDATASSPTHSITLNYQYVGSSTSSTQSTTSSAAMQTSNEANLSALTVQGSGSQSITNQSSIAQGISIQTAPRTAPTIRIINQQNGKLGTDVNMAMNIPPGQYLTPSANPAAFIHTLHTYYGDQNTTTSYAAATTTDSGSSGSIELYNQNLSFLSFNTIQNTSLQQFQLHGTSGILAVGNVCSPQDCGTGSPTPAAVNTITIKASSATPTSPDASTASQAADATSASTDTATQNVTTGASTDSTTETRAVPNGNGDPTALFVFPGATAGSSNTPVSVTSVNLSNTYNADIFILQGGIVHGNIDIGSSASNNRITMLQNQETDDDASSQAINLVIKTLDTNAPLSQILKILSYDETTNTYKSAQGYNTVITALPVGENLYQVVALPVQIGAKQLSDQLLLNKTHTTNQWLMQSQPAGVSYTHQSIDHTGYADTSIVTAAYPWDWSSGQAHTRMIAAFQSIQSQHHTESGTNRFEQNLTDMNAQLLLGHKWAWLSDTGWVHHTQWTGNGIMLSMQPTVSVGIGKSRLHRHYNTLQTNDQINVNARGRYWHAFASTGLELGSYYIMQDASRIGLRSYSTLSLGMQPEYREKDGPFYQWKWKSHTFSALYSQIGLDHISTSPEQGMSTRIGINALVQASLDQNIRFTNLQNTRESFSYPIPGLRRMGANVQVSVSYGSFDMMLGYDMLRNWNDLKSSALNQWHAGLHWRNI